MNSTVPNGYVVSFYTFNRLSKNKRSTPMSIGQIDPSKPVSDEIKRIFMCFISFLRKEVIQPQLPLRLPCYYLVPITSPTLGNCLPCGLAYRLQVLPAFMT